MLVEGFGHANTIVIMYKDDDFDRILLQIGVILIDIGPNFGTRLSLEFQLLF